MFSNVKKKMDLKHENHVLKARIEKLVEQLGRYREENLLLKQQLQEQKPSERSATPAPYTPITYSSFQSEKEKQTAQNNNASVAAPVSLPEADAKTKAEKRADQLMASAHHQDQPFSQQEHTEKYGGFIGFFGLTHFWENLSAEEQQVIRTYWSRWINDEETEADYFDNPYAGYEGTRSDFVEFFHTIINEFLENEQFPTAEKLILCLLEAELTPLEQHLTYNQAIQLYFSTNDNQNCLAYCLQDVELLPAVTKDFLQTQGSVVKEEAFPETPAFYTLINLYEQQQDFDKIATICQFAVEQLPFESSKKPFRTILKKLAGSSMA